MAFRGNSGKDFQLCLHDITENHNTGFVNKTTMQHMMVVMALFAVVSFLIGVNLTHSQSHIDAFEEYGFYSACLFFIISFIPCLSIPFVIGNCCGLVFYNPFKKAQGFPVITSVPFICFRTVTRGDIPEFVIKNALRNKMMCLSIGLEKFVIEIVTDKAVNCGTERYVREIVVPDDYKTRKGTMFKARALNYCLGHEVNTLAGNDWIVHLDEETLLTEEALFGIIKFVTSGNADIGQGPIRYLESEIVTNWVTTLADSIRLCLDYALFRFQFALLGRPIFGFKGSYVVIRNKVEMDIGLDQGPKGSIAEDCFFALKAWSKGYTFDFIMGEMTERSPICLIDYVRQRRRWFIGQLYTVLSKEIPSVNKFGIILSLVCCLLMPVSLSNIVINLLYPFQKPFLLCAVNGFVGGTFIYLYAFGSFLTTSKRNWTYSWRVLISMFCCFCILPIAVVLESFATYWGLLSMNTNEFFIIKKDVSTDENTFQRNKDL